MAQLTAGHKRSRDDEPPRIGVALADVIESGEELIADRVELSLLKVQQKVATSLARSTFVLAGVVAAVVAWTLFNSALIDTLTLQLSRPWALVIVGLLHAGLATVLLLFARRQGRTIATIQRGDA